MSSDISFKLNTADVSVVLLAAGRGERMRPLTDVLPKPLLEVAGQSLIEHHLLRLATAGFSNIVINTAYLGEKIWQTLGDGSQYNLNISYSDESDTGALETAGGLKKALELIHSEQFIVINADIWTDFAFESLLEQPFSGGHIKGRLVLVPNPDHNPKGDFSLNASGALGTANNKYTFSGIALYQRRMFERLATGKQALGPVFRDLIEKQELEGVLYEGEWTDVGTPERLETLNQKGLNTL